MTWVAKLPKVGHANTSSTFDIYYRTNDGKWLRWYGGRTEAAARKEAAKTLAADSKKPVYKFKSAVIVETVITDTVTRHIEL